MKILEELFYGNIDVLSKRRKVKDKEFGQKEISLHDKLRSRLSREDQELFDEYLDVSSENNIYDLMDKYIQGFKTGLLIAIECKDYELN